MEEKKYKLLVVDDEPVISDGLRELFAGALGADFEVKNCFHPKRALEIFSYFRPDLVVSDVKMPKMTGIEMAGRMRKLKPELRVLFLSGYDEFELVYSAIRQEADDYILKTEGDGAILGAVQKMAEVIRREKLFMEEYESARSRAAYMEPVFRQQALVRLLDGSVASDREFRTLMEGLKAPIPEHGRLLMAVGVIRERAEPGMQENILETVEQMLRRAWGEVKLGELYKVIYRDSLVWLMETEERELGALIFVTILEIQKLIAQKLALTMSFCIAQESVRWSGLKQKYGELRSCLRRQSISEESSVILENREEPPAVKFNGEDAKLEQSFGLLTKKLGLWEELLFQESFQEFRAGLEECLAAIAGARRHSMYALELYYSVGRMLISYINRKNIRAELAGRIQLMELFDPGSFCSWEEAAGYLRALTEALAELCELADRNTIITAAERIKSHILSHLSEDLSLTAVGRAVGFSPVYLSRIFKQCEGVGLREYIEEQRMEQGLRLIQNSRLKIYEVAGLCGYQNPAYFIKIFKAHYGVTPQEYREGKILP